MGQTWLTSVAVQSSQAGTADTRVTAGTTNLDTTDTGNADEAYEAVIELNVTTAPSTATFAKLYMEESEDDTNFGAPKVIGAFLNIGTSAGRYTVRVYDLPPLARFTWEPVAFNMTATMNARPSVPV